MRKLAAAVAIIVVCVVVFFALRPPIGPNGLSDGQKGFSNPNPIQANQEQFDRIKPYLYTAEPAQ